MSSTTPYFLNGIYIVLQASNTVLNEMFVLIEKNDIFNIFIVDVANLVKKSLSALVPISLSVNNAYFRNY